MPSFWMKAENRLVVKDRGSLRAFGGLLNKDTFLDINASLKSSSILASWGGNNTEVAEEKSPKGTPAGHLKTMSSRYVLRLIVTTNYWAWRSRVTSQLLFSDESSMPLTSAESI